MKRLWILLNLAYYCTKLELVKMENERLKKEFAELSGTGEGKA